MHKINKIYGVLDIDKYDEKKVGKGTRTCPFKLEGIAILENMAGEGVTETI